MSAEHRVIALVTMVQFINIVDFMMVMPLGPDFALALGIDVSHIGIVAGAYTLAASIVAIAGAKYLDRFDRKTGLVIAIAGLSLGTLAAAFAWNLTSLVVARMLAGLFGGPATSLALSAVIDVVPVERRGRAMAIVMGAFSAASVLGVPFGLELAEWYQWNTPFLVLGGLGVVATGLLAWLMPSLRGHLEGMRPKGSLLQFLARRNVRNSMLVIVTAMFSGFLLIPHLSTFFQFNMDYPRGDIGLLYMVGGAVSFFIMQIAGRIVDRIGSVEVAWFAVGILTLVLGSGFILLWQVPVMLLFVALMSAMSMRMVALQALLSKVPEPNRRASFLALQSATQHFSAGSAAVVSAFILVEEPDKSLGNVPLLAALFLALTVLMPMVMRRVQEGIRGEAH